MSFSRPDLKWERFGAVLEQFLGSFLLSLKNRKVVFLLSIFLSLVQYLGFEVQGCGCSFLATIHTPFSLLIFLTSFCSIKCFIYFSQHVLQLSYHVYLRFAMIFRFDVVGLAFLGARMCLNFMFVLRFTCFQAPCHVYTWIYMLLCSLPCFCLDLHVSVQIYVHTLKSMCLCASCHAYVLRSMLVLCHVLLQPFLSIDISLSFFLALLVRCRSRSCVQGQGQPYINWGLRRKIYARPLICKY